MNVTVVGCGYVGLVTAVGLASVGHRVVGVEHDPARRARIAACEVPFYEPGLPDALAARQQDGTFRVSDELAEALDADVIMLCVQTPQGPDGAIDLTALANVSEDLAGLPLDDGRRRVVVVRSTVVPGTGHEVVAPRLASVCGTDTLALASNPEFLREGSALADFVEADRVLVGCDEQWAGQVLRRLYEPLGAPLRITGVRTAELTKYASNALLATLVSFSNEVARLAESTPEVDAEDVFDVLQLDRRLRPIVDGQPITPGISSYLRAGCGFGGSCLPKDVAALSAYGRSVDEATPLLDAVLAINRTQPSRLVDLAEREVGDLAGQRVAVLGAAFKGGTDDLRASPGLAVVDELLRRGARVVVHDPLVGAEALASYQQQGVRIADDLDGALADVVAVLVTTNAGEYRAVGAELPPDGPVVVDGRRVIDPATIAAGYAGIGLAGQRLPARS